MFSLLMQLTFGLMIELIVPALGLAVLWKCVEDAQRWHDESFRQRVLSAFGSEPSYQYFDTPVIVDNAARDIMIEAA